MILRAFRSSLLVLVLLMCTGGDLVDGSSPNGIRDVAKTTIHVDDDAPIGGDGQSWATAYRYLQDALAVAVAADVIYVAGGVYKPDQDEGGNATPDDRRATFQLVNGMRMTGGYRGCPGGDCGNGNPYDVDINLYESILSADLAGDDIAVASPADLPGEPTRSENSYHVLTSSGAERTTLLAGFTVTGGNANGGIPHNRGGGMNNSGGPLELANCTFTRNSAAANGGGMFNSFSDLKLTNCTFSKNSVSRGAGEGSRPGNAALTNSLPNMNTPEAGGGMYNLFCDPTLRNCTFSENSAVYGGAMGNYFANPTLTNCALVRNSAEVLGGGMYSTYYSSATLANCTFSRNSAQYSGAAMLNNTYSNPILTDCILWDGGDEISNRDGATITVTYSCVQDEDPVDDVVYPGEGNSDDDPLFVPGPVGDLYLSQTAAGQAQQSPCVDAGRDTAANLDLDTMTTRSDEGVDTGIVDMGYHYPVTGAPFIMGDYDRNGVLDLADFSHFQICFTEAGPVYVSPSCRIFDFGDPDSDVDEDDYAAFHVAFEDH